MMRCTLVKQQIKIQCIDIRNIKQNFIYILVQITMKVFLLWFLLPVLLILCEFI